MFEIEINLKFYEKPKYLLLALFLKNYSTEKTNDFVWKHEGKPSEIVLGIFYRSFHICQLYVDVS